MKCDDITSAGVGPSVQATPVLRLLVSRSGFLESRLRWLGYQENAPVKMLKRLARNVILPETQLAGLPLMSLEEAGLVTRLDQGGTLPDTDIRAFRERSLSLRHVTVLNIELTWRCDMACSHCFQRRVRSRMGSAVLAGAVARGAIQDAWFCGMLTRALNLTGGEAIAGDIPIFELIDYAKSLAVPVRLNTNSWWGNCSDFCVAWRTFRTPGHLASALKECGLARPAVSFDARLRRDSGYLRRLQCVVLACEEAQLDYDVICTARTERQVAELLAECDIGPAAIAKLRHCHPVFEEEVELCDPQPGLLGTGCIDPVQVAAKCACGGKGFYRPSVLTIDPHGGVRSCRFAAGLWNMGNVNCNSLRRIVNRFPSDPVSMAFREGVFPSGASWHSTGSLCAACAQLALSLVSQ